MKITDGHHEAQCEPGITVSACLTALGLADEHILAVRQRGRMLALNEPVTTEAPLTPITLEDEEGRRIYERSLRFVMLLALHRLYPGEQVRMEYSVGHGVFIRLPGLTMSSEMVVRTESVMRALIASDLPFVVKQWAKQDAIEYFEQDGQRDKVALLHRLPADSFPMYCCGGLWEYCYGVVVPSTRYVRVFTLVPHAPGFILQLPAADLPDEPAPYIPMPKHLTVFSQSAAWCQILGVVNAADVGTLIEQKSMRTFIRVNEALHVKALSALADRITELKRRIVLIAGPSSSGKTTFAKRLCVQLRVLGRHPVQISLDNYYLDRDTLLREADGSLDLESIHTLDLPLLQEHVRRLIAGDTVEIPEFDFNTGKRRATGQSVRVEPGQPVVIEGIHGLNPLLSEGMPSDEIFRVFVSALSCMNLDDHNRIRTTDVRLLRRVVRDHQFRGTAPQDTLAMWRSVRLGEERWIFPYQEEADVVFNTALHYELPILKLYAFDLLQAISPDEPTYSLAQQLLKVLNYFPELSPDTLDEIPPLSLLREFIGGCTFDKE